MKAVTVSRRSILQASAGATVALYAPAVLGAAKSKYAGTTIHGGAFSLPFHQYLKNYFPEFEEQTGIKVNFDIQAFPIYNQRMDLELSTGGSSLRRDHRHLHLPEPLDRCRLGQQPGRVHHRPKRHASRLGRRRLRAGRGGVDARRQGPHLCLRC